MTGPLPDLALSDRALPTGASNTAEPGSGVERIDVAEAGADATEVSTVSGFTDFYQRHAATIGVALELTLQHPELAQDALNEAMTRAFSRWKQVGEYANPSGWVYRVGLNWARSWLRRRRREQRRAVAVGPDHGVGPIDSFEPGLAAALGALSVEHRSVVVCRFYLDFSTAATAAALAIAEGTVKSRLSRALDGLRRDLGVGDPAKGGQR